MKQKRRKWNSRWKSKKANKAKEQIIEKTKREAKTKAERVISNTHLKVRNNKLEAKQEMINKVFDEAVIKLQNLPQEEYLNFIKIVFYLWT